MKPEIRAGQIWTVRGYNKPVIVISKYNACCLVDKDGRKRENFPETTKQQYIFLNMVISAVRL